MDLLIDVTDECIDHGVRLRSTCCPVALAARNALPGYTAIVGCFRIRWQDSTGKVRYSAETPKPLVDFVIAFDNGVAVTPLQVTVELIEEPQTGKG